MHLSRVFRLDQPASPLNARAPAVLAGAALAIFTAAALAQVPTPLPAPVTSAPASAAAAAASRPPAVATAAAASRPVRGVSGSKANNRQPTRPLWRELKSADLVALAPLAGTWDTLSVAQKRKWLALSRNYPKLTPDEQGKLHSRMTEWAALSAQQRAQARLNFGETKQLSPDDKKAKWEAYQALPPEEKRKLAAVAAKTPPTAPAVRPVPTDRLATIPKPKLAGKPLAAASAAPAPAKSASAASGPIGAGVAAPAASPSASAPAR